MLRCYETTIAPVDCRIGSLEIERAAVPHGIRVDCRIGSLENNAVVQHTQNFVDCRKGSLEKSIIAAVRARGS